MNGFRTLSVLLLYIVLPTTTAGSDAGTVRGLVVTADSAKLFAGAAVTLENKTLGRSATVYTGADGMYYLRNVPPGTYTLEVRTSTALKKYRVVIQPKPYVDIMPISAK